MGKSWLEKTQGENLLGGKKLRGNLSGGKLSNGLFVGWLKDKLDIVGWKSVEWDT